MIHKSIVAKSLKIISQLSLPITIFDVQTQMVMKPWLAKQVWDDNTEILEIMNLTIKRKINKNNG